MKKILITLFLFGTITMLFAQNTNSISASHSVSLPFKKYYTFGDTIPNLTVSNIINYKTTSAKISDFRGKILILDYWATWCGSCIGAFPKDDELQKQFEGKVQFLLITKESDKLVKDFISKSKKYKRMYPNLTFVSEDTALHKLIHIASLPTWAFIDKNGILRGITIERDSLNAKNIQGMIDKKYPQQVFLPTNQKKTDINKPLFINGNSNDNGNIVSYSVISKSDENTRNTNTTNHIDKKLHKSITYYGAFPIKFLYQYAFYDEMNLPQYQNRLEYVPGPRVLLEIKDTSEVVIILNDTINKKSLYTYQSIIPETTRPQVRSLMKEDLKKSFKYDVRVEKRLIKCLILTSQDTTLLVSKGGKPEVNAGPYDFDLKNETFWYLQAQFNYSMFLGYPLIDETGYKGNTDISIQADLKKWKSIAQALKKYGLSLKLEDRSINMLVIKDAKDVSL